MVGIKKNWRLYVGGSLAWDNKAGSGTLPVRSIELRLDEPTSVKQISIVLELTTATKAIEQGDVIRLDGYSDEAAGWVNCLYGEVVELERSSGDDSVSLTGYCALWWAACKEISETTLTNGSLIEETFNCQNDHVTLGNANQLVHIPLEDLLIREPLLLNDFYDAANPLTYQLAGSAGGPWKRCCLTLAWVGQEIGRASCRERV